MGLAWPLLTSRGSLSERWGTPRLPPAHPITNLNIWFRLGPARRTIRAMALEITWLGRNCFRLKGREGIVLTDPFPPGGGYKLGKVDASVVTVSRLNDPAYGAVEGLPESARVLNAPGEYEVGGILVTGVANKCPDGTRNVIFIIELDGIRVGHAGLPGAPGVPDELKGVDILLIPVGGLNAVPAAAAWDMAQSIDARITIPMNYKTDDETLELEPLDRFLKETGAKPEPQPRLQVSKTQLPAQFTLMVLQPRS